MSYFYQGLGHPIAHSQIVRDLNGTGTSKVQIQRPGLAGTSSNKQLYGNRMRPRNKPSQWANLGNLVNQGKHGPSHPN